MDVDLLKAFSLLAEKGNYRIAAEALFITQSALTKKIQRLEEQTGAVLFERNRRGAELTQVGKTLLPEARRILTAFSGFESLSRTLSQGAAGHLNIGFGISAYHLAPRLIAEFKQQYPEVHVTLNDIPSEQQHEALLSGELQLSFGRIPAHQALMSHHLFRDRLVAVVPAEECESAPPRNPTQTNHAEGDAGDGKLWDRLERMPYLALTPERGPGLHRQIQHYAASENRPLQPEQCANDILTLLALVYARLGYTLVPESAAAICPKDLRFIPLKGHAAEWEIGLTWNPDKPDPLRDKFLQMVQSKRKPQ